LGHEHAASPGDNVLAASVTRLHRYPSASLPFPFRITIADNASTDRSWPLARELAARLPRVAAVHLDQRGPRQARQPPEAPGRGGLPGEVPRGPPLAAPNR
jgi:hypothetical protein